MSTILFIVFVLIIVVAAIYHNLPKQPHKIIPALKKADVKLIFNGEQEDRICTCTYHKIKAKPDFVYEFPDGSLAVVEYKSRKKGVMPSDVAQLIATAIAVKVHYMSNKVKKGYVLTGNGRYKEINLDMGSDELMAQIQRPIKAVRGVIHGKMPMPEPSAIKCRGCGFRDVCKFSL